VGNGISKLRAFQVGLARIISALNVGPGEFRMHEQQQIDASEAGGRRLQKLSLLLVGSEQIFSTDMKERMIPSEHFHVVARSSSLLEAASCLESKAIDMVFLSSEYREEEWSLFAMDARRCGFAGLILLAADAPGKTTRTVELNQHGRNSIQAGDFFLHIPSRRVWIRGVEVQFRPLEFQLLHFLCTRPDELLSYQTLLEVLWDNPAALRQSLRSLIRDVRAKIEITNHPRYIITVRDTGYRFDPSPAPLP
jgi:DNA-binding winged helix-turn-helix (wHTH) protein